MRHSQKQWQQQQQEVQAQQAVKQVKQAQQQVTWMLNPQQMQQQAAQTPVALLPAPQA
jgi:hypothetical protein